MDSLTIWYSNLSQREQLILQIAAPLVVFILLLMLLNQSYSYNAEQQTKQQHLLEDYQWLRTDTRAIGLWQADFGRRSLGDLSEAAELGLLLNNGLSKYGIRGNLSANNNGSWQLTVNPSDGNQVLSFIEAAVGSGATPTQIKLTRANTKGKVSGHLIFSPVLTW